MADECFAGIYRIMMPVLCKDEKEIEGFISACGRPFISCDRVYCCCIKDTLELDEQVVQDLLARLRPMGPRTLKDMKEYIRGFVCGTQPAP